ncbi:MAG: lytic transglycosylase domain-containing protein [Spirochaetota bacterium]
MPVESVYENIRNILIRIEEIKRRFGVSRVQYGSSFGEQLRQQVNKTGVNNTVDERKDGSETSDGDSVLDESRARIYGPIIEAVSKKYGIPSELIRAVVKQESNFNVNAISRKGAMGLMQLMPQTADLLGVQNPFNPEENIVAGTRYLVDLINRYGGNLNKALAAYNAGPRNVEDEIPDIEETRSFVDSVLRSYEEFSRYGEEEGL